MIHLLNASYQHVGYFKNYNNLADYIHKIELSRTRLLIAIDPGLNIFPNWEQEHWGFTIYHHEFSKSIYLAMREPPLTRIELEAFQQELDLIEIHYGDADNPVQIPVKEDTDIESLRRDWCFAYCKAHDYIILENQDFFCCEDTRDNGGATGGEDDMAL